VCTAGIVVAIDDCYEVWGSGGISIPWNFSTQDLKPQLLKLLGSRSSTPKAPSASNDTTTSAKLCSRAGALLRPVVLGSLGQHASCKVPRYCSNGVSICGSRVTWRQTQQNDLRMSCTTRQLIPCALNSSHHVLIPNRSRARRTSATAVLFTTPRHVLGVR
jgi:hypothetical protein